MARFIVLLGTSSVFGATAHAVHLQLGTVFFEIIFFIMNALSLLSIYYCFRSAYTYQHLNNEPSKIYIQLALFWIAIVLLICVVNASFLIIKIHAAISLIYSLLVHAIAYKRHNQQGSKLVVVGIAVAFISILAHSLKISFHAWFNYKDLSHVIMILSLVIIYRGIKLNVDNLEATQASVAVV
ncbi:MAG: hypothetical protein IT236_10260 [Bacteroidia bacterium]|nr:hypothetical protein [Bacteroidia bacterium]